MNHLIPEVSAWYQDVITGTLFEVVAYDEDSGYIEYQMVDGEVGEYDTAAWKELFPSPAPAPEDWHSAFELNQEDSTYADDTMVPDNLSGVLSELEPDISDLEDDFGIL